MSKKPYYLKERQADGSIWVSPLQEPADDRSIAQAVIAGHTGNIRWAEHDDGEYVYGLDQKGTVVPKPTRGSVRGVTQFEKILNPGSVKIGKTFAKVFVRVRYDGKRLSITGVSGPLPSGNMRGGAGQIVDELAEIYAGAPEGKRAPGWSKHMVLALMKTWKRWHLNDMRAGCEHQRAEGWDKISPSCVGKPCPVCGYAYGSQWLFEPVPEEALNFLQRLPETKAQPAWV